MRYALKKVRNIVGRDIATGKNKFVLSDLKSLTISGSAEVVWADGADAFGTQISGRQRQGAVHRFSDAGNHDPAYGHQPVGAGIASLTPGLLPKFSGSGGR